MEYFCYNAFMGFMWNFFCCNVLGDWFQAHPGLTEHERKKLICRVLDCQRLSMDACMHAAQNDHLLLRTVCPSTNLFQITNLMKLVSAECES
jgi:hypothetical protein